jgi:hypothetical protein
MTLSQDKPCDNIRGGWTSIHRRNGMLLPNSLRLIVVITGIDNTVSAGTPYYYWLDAVSLQGAITRYGPISATVQPPTVVALSNLDVRSEDGGMRDHYPWWHIGGIALLLIGGWMWRERGTRGKRQVVERKA